MLKGLLPAIGQTMTNKPEWIEHPDDENVVDYLIYTHTEKYMQAIKKPKLFGWFVGQAMKMLDGKGNPAEIEQLFKSKIPLIQEVVARKAKEYEPDPREGPYE